MIPLLFVLLVSSCACFESNEISLVTNRNQNVPSVIFQIDKKVKLFPITLSTPSYIYANLDFDTEGQRVIVRDMENTTVYLVSDSNVQCPSNYCVITNGSDHAVFNDTILGPCSSATLNLEFNGMIMFRFPMLAVFARVDKVVDPVEGRVNLFDLVNYAKQSDLLINNVCGLSLEPGHEHILMGKSVGLRVLDKISTGESRDRLEINSVTVGQKVFKTTQMILSVDTENFMIPRSIENGLLEEMKRQKINCWFEEDVLGCEWNNVYPDLKISHSNMTLKVEQDHLINQCYFSPSRRALICQFHIQLYDKHELTAGRAFIRRYPVSFDLQNNTVMFHETVIPTARRGIFALIVHGLFGWSVLQFWLAVSFAGVLLVLKLYHFYVKRLPMRAYDKYSNLVTTSSLGGVQSESSERELAEINIIKEQDQNKFDIA